MSQNKYHKAALIAKINRANKERYEDGLVVEEYISEPYHQLRISIALEFLIAELDRNFSDVAKEKIKVIDIGTGSGYVAKKINEKGFTVVAADFEENNFKQQITPSIQIVSLDANERFPFDDGSFHAIFTGELIEHLFDTAHFLTECKRILKSKGVLVVTTPNLAGLQDRICFLFGFPPRHVSPLHPYLKLHIRQFSYRSLQKFLYTYGFKNIKIKSNYWKFYIFGDIKLYFRFMAIFFPNLGGSLIAKAVKP